METLNEITRNSNELSKGLITWTTQEWSRKILSAACHYSIRHFRTLKERGYLLPDIYTRERGREPEILMELYARERRMESLITSKDSSNLDSYITEKTHYLRSIAEDIQKRKHFHLLGSLVASIYASGQAIEKTPSLLTGLELLMIDVSAIYLLVCSPERFLVGLKDHPVWKRVSLPDFDPNLHLPVEYIARPFLFFLDRIGIRESMVIPERIPDPIELEKGKVAIPQPAKSIDALLEDAYFRQRYLIPPEGAEVRFRKAGDVEKMLLIQSGDNILANTTTPQGDFLTSLDINKGSFVSSDYIMVPSQEHQIPLPSLVAEVYHDMVTAIEIPTSRYRRLRRARGTTPDRDDPQVIFIPRIVRTGPVIERPPYDGPPRPVRPHQVSGHRRRANMTEGQRQNIIEFEQKNDISILKHLPGGYTFVRPFKVPADADIKSLPIFIKRRIETQLAQSLQRP